MSKEYVNYSNTDSVVIVRTPSNGSSRINQTGRPRRMETFSENITWLNSKLRESERIMPRPKGFGK